MDNNNKIVPSSCWRAINSTANARSIRPTNPPMACDCLCIGEKD